MTAHTQHDLYANERASLIDELRTLTPEQAAAVVPSCPAWTVKDVVSHMSGLVAEKLADVPPPLGSDESTSRQVADRAAMTLAEVVNEWERNAPAFRDIATDDSPFIAAFLSDLVVHAHDIREGLGLPIDERSPAMMFAAERYLELLLDRAADDHDTALTVELTGVGIRAAATGSRSLELRAAPFDFLRAVTARRSREAVESLDWTGDPSDLLNSGFVQYGTLEEES
ncbi:MAG: maleylpyruvate isomerase family mycothiol-dependent enzyme [Acidimicrobiales bacterium]